MLNSGWPIYGEIIPTLHCSKKYSSAYVKRFQPEDQPEEKEVDIFSCRD